MKWPIVCALLTALFWGLYGPVLAWSRTALGSPFKPYVAIGVAYLVWGVVGGLVGMHMKGDSFAFAGEGIRWGFVAGSLGAWGALALTLSMFTGGSKAPHLIMPIVFGGAVSVAAIYSLWRTGAWMRVNPLMYVGILGIVVCAMLVAYLTPAEKAPTRTTPDVRTERSTT